MKMRTTSKTAHAEFVLFIINLQDANSSKKIPEILILTMTVNRYFYFKTEFTEV